VDVIGSAVFQPQAAAFTSLLHMCAKNKQWDKALEVFQGMKQHYPAVVPNTVHFSSLISACGTAGRWREALEVSEYLHHPTQGFLLYCCGLENPPPPPPSPRGFANAAKLLLSKCTPFASQDAPHLLATGQNTGFLSARNTADHL